MTALITWHSCISRDNHLSNYQLCRNECKSDISNNLIKLANITNGSIRNNTWRCAPPVCLFGIASPGSRLSGPFEIVVIVFTWPATNVFTLSGRIFPGYVYQPKEANATIILSLLAWELIACTLHVYVSRCRQVRGSFHMTHSEGGNIQTALYASHTLTLALTVVIATPDVKVTRHWSDVALNLILNKYEQFSPTWSCRLW